MPSGALLNARAQHEEAYLTLRRMVGEGRLTSGQQVTVRSLSEMLGTGPMPVRDAVRRLVQDRSLEMLPNRTLRVPVMTRTTFDELTELRLLVEGAAAARAAEAMTDESFAALREINERMTVAINRLDPIVVTATNREFHELIYTISGSTVMREVIDGLWQRSGPYLAVLLRALSESPPALLKGGFGHHFEMLAAFGTGDAEAARAAMCADIGNAAQWFRDNVPFNGTE